MYTFARVNGNQSSSKLVNGGNNHVSRSNLHQEDAGETSGISNPEETIKFRADESNSGNVFLIRYAMINCEIAHLLYT